MKSYCSVNSVAKYHNSTSAKITKKCKEYGYELLPIMTKVGNVANFFERRYLDQLNENLSMERKYMEMRNKKNMHQNKMDQLKKYFDDLKIAGEHLPRRAGKPNIFLIAKATKINRFLLTNDTDACSLLNMIDAEEKLALGIGNSNFAETVSNYFNALIAAAKEFPREKNGKLNKLKIAQACGIDRYAFYNNSDLKSILEKFE